MKFLLPGLITLLFSATLYADAKSVFEFNVNNIDGKEVNLADYKGKVLVIVNTASKCGFTKQYADLVKLQKDYADKGVVVLGFPANNFGGQEPGSNQEIAEFCSSKFGVDFPMFAKVSVKGDDQSPLFQYLTQAENPDFTGNIRWNFEKFLVDGDGVLRHRFRSTTNPSDEKFRKELDALLSAQTVLTE
jgi:glutathione peroxidase